MKNRSRGSKVPKAPVAVAASSGATNGRAPDDQPPGVKPGNQGISQVTNDNIGLVKWKKDIPLTDKLISQLYDDSQLREALIIDGALCKVDDDDNSKDESFFKLGEHLFKANSKYEALAAQISQAETGGNTGDIVKVMKERWRQLANIIKAIDENLGDDAKGIKSENDIKNTRGEVKRKLEKVKTANPWYFRIRSLLEESSDSTELTDTASTQDAKPVSTGKQETKNQDSPDSNIGIDKSEPVAVTVPSKDMSSTPNNALMATLVENGATAVASLPQTPHQLNPPVNAADDGSDSQLDKGEDTTQEGESADKAKVVDTQNVLDGAGIPTAQVLAHIPITAPGSPLADEGARQTTPQVQDHISLGVEHGKEHQDHASRPMTPALGRSASHPRSAASAQRVQEETESSIPGKIDELTVERTLQAKSPELDISTEPTATNDKQVGFPISNQTNPPTQSVHQHESPIPPTAPGAGRASSPEPIIHNAVPIVLGDVTTSLEQVVLAAPPDNTLSASNGAHTVTTVGDLKTGATEDIASRSQTPRQRNSSVKVADDKSGELDEDQNTTLEGTSGRKHEGTNTQSATGGAGAHTAQVLATIPITASVPSLAGGVARQATPQVQDHVSPEVEDGKEWQSHTSRSVTPSFRQSTTSAHGIQDMAEVPRPDKSDKLTATSTTPAIPDTLTTARSSEPTTTSAHQAESSMLVVIDESTTGPDQVVIITPSDDTPSAPNGAPMVTTVKNPRTGVIASRQINSPVKANGDELDTQPDKGGNTTQKGTSGSKQEDADTQNVAGDTGTPTMRVFAPVPIAMIPLVDEVVHQATPKVQNTTTLGVHDEQERQGDPFSESNMSPGFHYHALIGPSSRPMTPAFGRSTPSAHRVQERAESRISVISDKLATASALRAQSPAPAIPNVAPPMIDTLTKASADRGRSPTPVAHHEPTRTGALVESSMPATPDESTLRLAQGPQSPIPEDRRIIKEGAHEVTTTTRADHLVTGRPVDFEALDPDPGKQLPIYSVEDGMTPAGSSGSRNHNLVYTSNSVPEERHRDEKHPLSAPSTSQIRSDANIASARDETSPEKVKSGKEPILERTGEVNRAASPAHVPTPGRVTPVLSVENSQPRPIEATRKPVVKENTRNIGNGNPVSHPSKVPSQTSLSSAVKLMASAASGAATPAVSESLAIKAGQVGVSRSRNVSGESQVTVRATDQQPKLRPEVTHAAYQDKDSFSKMPRSSAQLQTPRSQRVPAPIPVPSQSHATPAFSPGPSQESSQAVSSHVRTMEPALNIPGNAAFPTVDIQDHPKASRSQIALLPILVAGPRDLSYATPTFPPGPPPPEPSSAIASRPQTAERLLGRPGSVTYLTAETQPQLPVGSSTIQGPGPEEVKHAAHIPTPGCVVPVLPAEIQQDRPVKVAFKPTVKDSTRSISVGNVNLASSQPSEAPSRPDLTLATKRTASAVSTAATSVASGSPATGGKQAGAARPKNLSGEFQAAVKAKDRQREQKQEPEPEPSIPIVYQGKDFLRKMPQGPIQAPALRSQTAEPLPMPGSGPLSSSVVIPAFRPGPPSPTVSSHLRTVDPTLNTPGSATFPIAETQSQPPVVNSEIPNHYARTIPAPIITAAGSITTPIITNIDDRSHLSSNDKRREPSTIQPLTSSSERPRLYSESQSMAPILAGATALGSGADVATKLDDQRKDGSQRRRTSAEQQPQQVGSSAMVNATAAQQQGSYRPFVPVPGSSYTQLVRTPVAFDFGDRMDSRAGMGRRRSDGARGSALTASVSRVQHQVGAVPSPSRSNSFRSESTVREIRPTLEDRYDRDRREREREREREQEEERYGLMRRRRRDDDRRIATTRVRYTSPTRLDDRSRSTTRRRYASPARSDVECDCSSCRKAWIWKSLEYCGVVVALTLYLAFMAKLFFQDQGVRMVRS
ncbi:hypothetical protein FRB95_013118 [Tulasnella sp. JGI-2019a]|nr:hypothetical protein FRB95_013118 [Tulasnella sp. JGI-2019a]